jgi:large subunit ribosomal protein L18e
MSLSKVVKNAAKAGNKTLVCVCKVLDDERLLTIPKLTVCCLKIAESARKRILAAGGNVLTFDQLALKAPTGLY